MSPQHVHQTTAVESSSSSVAKLGPQNVGMSPQDLPFVLVGTYTNTDVLAHEPSGQLNHNSIEVFRSQSDGTLTPMTKDCLDIVNPAFILKHYARNDIFFVSTERIDQNGEIVTVKLDGETGNLSILSRIDSGGKSTCYLTYLPGNKYLTAVHYWNAKLTTFPILDDGTLGTPVGECQQGNGKYADENIPDRFEHWAHRQRWSHAHCAVLEPYTNAHLFVCDLGEDKVMIYPADNMAQEMRAIGEVQLNRGIGPRHIVFHKTHRTAYCVNELVSSVSVFDYVWNEGDVSPTLVHRQTIPTLPADWIEKKTTKNGVWKALSHCSEIRLHPSGNFLYVGNRGHESIVVYRVDHDNNGQLEIVDIQGTGGECPRNFNFIQNGRSMVVGNQNTNTLVSFDICPKSGRLTQTKSVTCRSPNYVFTF